MALIALLVALWHIVLALVLWNAPGPLMATPFSFFYVLFGTSRAVAVVLLAVSFMALAGKRRWPSGWRLFLCLVPQQAALMLSAGAAVAAVVFGHYSDGVMRPRDFIFLDQSGTIFFPTVLHTIYMVWLFAHSFNGNSVHDE